uniref:YchJ family protein n=1 Tax=Ningiella ruwaisensis TaxID=2364274 RepID=UPI00109F148D|nr:YchJ family metal-binding protein [Ningiella ruwaisensis]
MIFLEQHCPCKSMKRYEDCCLPILNDEKPALNCEQLMRSRYTAYCVNNFEYIVNTYSLRARNEQNISVDFIKHQAASTKWLHLNVVNSHETSVEFKAFYQDGRAIYCLHELSYFVQENGKWRYDNGDLLGTTGKLKTGRNEACFCDSGKKFKHCCM